MVRGVVDVPVEIERKFLVLDDAWRQSADAGTRIRQGYIVGEDHCSVRVRIRSNGECTLTVKLPHNGMSRYEFEHNIDQREAEGLMELSRGAILDKHRYLVEHQGLTWEIDVYDGANSGLVVAEIELSSEGQNFEAPAWIGPEVTGQERYQNSRLAREPFEMWPAEETQAAIA
ncbi:MAG: CYTH domain-containing protein [Pseudomonadota bacterium]